MSEARHDPDFEKVEKWDDLQEKVKKVGPVGFLFIVLGLFSPWISWESQGDIPAGSIIGLELLDGALDPWLFLFFGFLSAYFFLRKEGFLSNLFTSFWILQKFVVIPSSS